jgi:hypothetical protein
MSRESPRQYRLVRRRTDVDRNHLAKHFFGAWLSRVRVFWQQVLHPAVVPKKPVTPACDCNVGVEFALPPADLVRC